MATGHNKRGVVAVLNDMIFETKLRSTARSLGVAVDVVKSNAAMITSFRKTAPSLVVVDLNSAGDAQEAVKSALSQPFSPHVIAFVSHVDEELSKQAREAGAHQVLARSQFNAQLPQLLQAHGGVAVVPDPSI